MSHQGCSQSANSGLNDRSGAVLEDDGVVEYNTQTDVSTDTLHPSTTTETDQSSGDDGDADTIRQPVRRHARRVLYSSSDDDATDVEPCDRVQASKGAHISASGQMLQKASHHAGKSETQQHSVDTVKSATRFYDLNTLIYYLH